jgi:hypothetical protein
MSTMSDSPDVELLHRAWEAMTGGDFAVLENLLAEDAKWQAGEDQNTADDGVLRALDSRAELEAHGDDDARRARSTRAHERRRPCPTGARPWRAGSGVYGQRPPREPNGRAGWHDGSRHRLPRPAELGLWRSR